MRKSFLLVGELILPEAFKMDTAYKIHVGKKKIKKWGREGLLMSCKCDSLPLKKRIKIWNCFILIFILLKHE